MDFTAIVASLIGGGVTLTGVLIANSRAQAVTEERINQLRKEVEKHNGVIERTFTLEKDVLNLFHRYEEMNSQCQQIPHIEERAEAAHRRIDRAGIDKAH